MLDGSLQFGVAQVGSATLRRHRTLPLVAFLSSVADPCAMRGAQAALSPAFGAPAAPLAWQAWQTDP